MNSIVAPQPRPGSVRPLVVFVLLLGLSGCQALSERMCELNNCEPLSPESDISDAKKALLEELDNLSGLSEEQRHAHYDALRPQLEDAGCRVDNVRLAMLYVTMDTPPQDDIPPLATAMEECMKTDEGRDFRGVARLLHSSLSQRAAQGSRIRELVQTVSREQTRNAELTEQLEALKAIERSLRDRGQTPSTTREE
ncbi:MAG: hypothetical protein WED00_08780 [Aquisalimonadaceae bacterium]